MSRIVSFVAVLCMVALCLTSCNTFDDTPKYSDYIMSNGTYIVSEGSIEENVDGSLSFFYYQSERSSLRVFEQANKEPLGKKVTDAVVCGSKLYILAAGNKKLHVTDRITVAKKNELSLKDYTPRHIASDGTNIYVSTAESKILVIDTLSCTISKTYDCGPNSAGIKALSSYIVVANGKEEGSKENGSVTVINTRTNEVNNYKSDTIYDPSDIMLYGDDYGLHIYILDRGLSDENGNQTGCAVYEVHKDGQVIKICPATSAAISDEGLMYTIYAPKTTPATKPTYTIYDPVYGYSKSFISGTEIAAPVAIAVDNSYNGQYCVTITSAGTTTDGKLSETAPGKAFVYTSSGTAVSTFEVGPMPKTICINYGTARIQTN